MDRRSLLQAVPLLALPLPALAEPKRQGLPVVTFIEMLEEVPFNHPRPGLPPFGETERFWVSADHRSTYELVFDSRPSVKECSLDIGEDNPVLVEAMQRSPHAHKMAVLAQVVETACQLIFDEGIRPNRPDFNPGRCFMQWSDEHQATLCCTTNGPLGYRWADEYGSYGAIAFPERITSAWLQRGPRR